jgi:hypothetical protein
MGPHGWGRMGPHGAAWGHMGRMGVNLKDPRGQQQAGQAVGRSVNQHQRHALGCPVGTPEKHTPVCALSLEAPCSWSGVWP